MSSILARQLSKIKEADVALGGTSLNSKLRPSVLFAAREAADYDVETIFSISFNGLLELNAMTEGAFNRFEKTLFSNAFKSFDRTLRTKAENEKLDRELSLFFKLLAPVFELEASAKVLEYLIRAFKIHEFNANEVLLTFLPHHRSDLYLKLIKIMRIDTIDQFKFLAGCKTNEIAPDRAFIVSRCVAEPSLLTSYFKVLLESLKLVGAEQSKLSFRSSFSFLACLIMDVVVRIKQEKDEKTIASVLSVCIEANANAKGFPELQIISYLGFMNLSCACQLSSAVNDRVISSLCKGVLQVNVEKMIRTLCLLFHTQNRVIKQFPEGAAKSLVKMENLFPMLKLVHDNCSVFPMLKFFLPHIISGLCKHEAYVRLLVQIMCEQKFQTLVTADFVASILKFLGECDAAAVEKFNSSDESLRNELKSAFVLRHSITFGKGLQLYIKSRPEGEEDLPAIISYIVDGTDAGKLSSEEIKTILLSALQSATPLESLKEVYKVIKPADKINGENFARKVTLLISESLGEDESLIIPLLDVLLPLLLARKDRSFARGFFALPADHSKLTRFITNFSDLAAQPMAIANGLIGDSQIHLDLLEALISSKSEVNVTLAVFMIAKFYLPRQQLSYCKPLLNWLKSQRNVVLPTKSFEGLTLESLLDTNSSQLTAYALLQLSSQLKRSGESTSWFEKSIPEEAALVKETFVRICAMELSSDRIHVLEEFMKNQLKNDICQFLCSISVDANILLGIRAQALFLIKTLITALSSTAGNDLQMLYPTLFSLLNSPEKLLRKIALDCFDAICKIPKGEGESSQILFENLYANDSACVSLKKASSRTFCTLVTAKSTLFLYDPTDALATMFKGSKRAFQRELVQFFTSHYEKMNLDNSPLAQIIHGLDAIVRMPSLSKIISEECEKEEIEISVLEKMVDSCFGGEIVGNDVVSLLNDANNVGPFESLLKLAKKAPQVFFNCVPKALVESIKATKQAAVLSALLNGVVEGRNAIISFRAYVRDLKLPVAVYEHEMFEVKESLIKLLEEDNAKRGKSSSNRDAVKKHLDMSVTLMEVLSHHETESSSLDRSSLIPLIFDMLELMLNNEITSRFGYSLEYPQQVLFSLLLEILKEVQASDSLKVNEEHIRIELLVHALRASSENPQIHNQIYLLFAMVSTLCPDRALLSIMPLFTFMGTNTVRQDDNFTAHVMRKTINSVLPALLSHYQSVSQGGNVLNRKLKEVFKVFVDNLSHIPKFRQLDIFSCIAKTGGENCPFLFILLGLLCERISSLLLVGENNADGAESIRELVVMLVSDLDPSVFLSNISMLFSDLLLIPSEPIEDEKKLKEIESLYDLTNAKTFTRRFQYRVTCLETIGFVLSSISVQDKFDEGVLLEFVEKTLLLASMADKERYKGWKVVVDLAHDCLKEASTHLDLNSLASVMSVLLDMPDLGLKEKALVFLNERLKVIENIDDDKSASENCFNILSQKVLGVVSSAADAQMDGAVQSALLSLELLISSFSSLSAESIIPLMPVLLSEKAFLHPSCDLIVANAMICMASAASILGPRLVQFINQLMPKLIEHFKERVFGEACENIGSLLHISALSLLEVVLSHMALFMTPYLKSCLTFLLHPSLFKATSSSSSISKVKDLSRSILSEFSKVESRVILPIYFSLYQDIEDPSSLENYFSLLVSILGHMDRAQVSSFSSAIFKFLLEALMFPVVQLKGKIGVQEMTTCEVPLLHAFQSFVLKLSESSFKPLFNKFVAWNEACNLNDDDDNNDEKIEMSTCRSRMFYKVIDVLSGTLKSLFTCYLPLYLDNWLMLLGSFTSIDEFEVDPEDLLGELRFSAWKLLLSVMQKNLTHLGTAEEETLSEDQMVLVGKALIEQMSISGVEEEQDEKSLERVKAHLIPCLVQVFSSSSSVSSSPTESIWKPLNSRLLGALLRAPEAIVRRSGLIALTELYQRLGDELLILLPEMIPFLAEALEDEEESVERDTHSLIKVIEGYLGEPLQKYFDSSNVRK